MGRQHHITSSVLVVVYLISIADTSAASFSGCQLIDGTIKEDLQPGDSRTSPDDCTFCSCDESGFGYCDYKFCEVPYCVDLIHTPGVCCDVCPNGYNCRTPGGKIIPVGEQVTENGKTCSCPMTDYHNIGIGRPGPQATCS